MAEQSMRLNLIMGMVDKITSPIRTVTNQTQRAGQQIRETQQQLRGLSNQSADIDSFRKLKNAVGTTATELEEAQKKVADMAREMAQTANPSARMQRNFERARRAARSLSDEHDRQQAELQQLRNRLNQTGISTNNLTAAQRRIREETERTNRELQEQQRELQRVAQRQQQLSQLREKAGAAMVTGAAAGAGIVAAASPALETQSSGALIAAGQGESVEQARQYRDIITKIYSDSTLAIDQIAETVKAVISNVGGLANTSAEEIAKLTTKASAITQAYNIEAAKSSQVVSQLITNGLVKSSDEGFDLITAGLSKVSTEMQQEVPELLNEYGTHFRGMGFSGAESMQMIVDASKLGKIAMDKVGDAVKEFSIRGSDMSKASVETYEKIGLSAADMSNAIAQGGKGARDALMQTSKRLLQIEDPAERANAAIALFGTPIEDLAVDKIPEFLSMLSKGGAGMEGMEGAADKLSKMLKNNGSSSIQLIGRAISGSLMTAFNQFEPQIIAATTAVTGFINNNPKLIAILATIAGVIGVLALLGGVIALAGTAISGLGAAFTAAKIAVNLFTPSIIRQNIALAASKVSMIASTAATWAMAAAQKAQAVASSIMTAAQWALNAALLANPIGLVIAGIMALIAVVVLVIKYWEPLGAFFSGLWEKIKSVFSAGWEWIKSLLSFNPLEILSTVWGVVSDFFSGIWEGIKSLFSGAFDFIKDTLLSPISAIKDTLGGWWDNIFGDNEKSIEVQQKVKQIVDSAPQGTFDPATGEVQVQQGGKISAGQSVINYAFYYGGIVVHAAAGMDEKSLAQEVRKQLDERDRLAAQNHRNRLLD